MTLAGILSRGWAGRLGDDPERGADAGYALPPGHPLTWGLLTDGTVLDGSAYTPPAPMSFRYGRAYLTAASLASGHEASGEQAALPLGLTLADVSSLTCGGACNRPAASFEDPSANAAAPTCPCTRQRMEQAGCCVNGMEYGL